MLRDLILVGVGGGLGSIFRYLTSLYFQKKLAAGFPWGTFVANVLGCFIIGLITGLFHKNSGLSSELKLLLATGFCGGYTTFSTFSSEALTMFQSGNYPMAAGYIMSSLIVGIGAVILGYTVVNL